MTIQRILIIAAVAPILVGQGLAAAPLTTPQPAVNAQQNQKAVPARAPAPPAALKPLAPVPRFKGFVDLHTHPLSYLGFGGKLLHGGLDVGSYIPTDSLGVHDTVAKSIQQALGTDNCTHGGNDLITNQCGDHLRRIIISQFESDNHAHQAPNWARGFPQHYDKLPPPDGKDFSDWPTWDDIDHQKMWADSIRRAYQGGLRVMVALAVNNKTLADAVRGPGDKLPDDDQESAHVQITRTKEFVGRHQDFMEVAYSPSDLERIVKGNKLAVVLGIEVDNIGNINTKKPLNMKTISGVVRNIYEEGVRYIFPIHVLDNPLGGTAIYQQAFDWSNYREAGYYWAPECSNPADGITYHLDPSYDPKLILMSAVKLGTAFPPLPKIRPCLNSGHQNPKGLSKLGEFAIQEMMRLGMLIDIDHMSQRAANQALSIAEAVPGGYPLFSGHNNIRANPIGRGTDSEIARTLLQYKRIAKLHGMAGVGTGELTADMFLKLYGQVIQASDGAPAAFGTDTDGLVMGMPHRSGSNVRYDAKFPRSSLGTKQWDYNRDGVAHYGMIADFVKDLETLPGAADLINDHLMNGADYFLDSWLHAEAQKTKVK